MKKKRKMTTFWLIMIFVFAVGSAISVLMYNYSKDKSGSEKHSEVIKKQEEIGVKVDSAKSKIIDDLSKKNEQTGSLILDKMSSSKDEILKKQGESQKSVKNEIKETGNRVIDKVEENNKFQNKNQKEILGKLEDLKNPPKEPNGLYRDNKKWGSVENFKINEDGKSFTIDEINFDSPLKPTDNIWLPFQYKNYILKFQKVNTLISMFPPMATGIEGIILSGSNKK